MIDTCKNQPMPKTQFSWVLKYLNNPYNPTGYCSTLTIQDCAVQCSMKKSYPKMVSYVIFEKPKRFPLFWYTAFDLNGLFHRKKWSFKQKSLLREISGMKMTRYRFQKRFFSPKLLGIFELCKKQDIKNFTRNLTIKVQLKKLITEF